MPIAQSGTPKAVPAAEIEAALARVLESARFQRAERLSRFLNHIVREALDGRADHLRGYAIGIDVFDRPEDFDPSTDTIVRVEARRLRQTLRAYYLEDGAADPIEISMPRGGYAPAFERRNGQAGMPAAKLQVGATRTTIGPRVAVLPFDDYSPSDGRGFFANGLTEQLIAALARHRELSVISRHTASQYSGENFDLAALRDQLGVDYFFEGSIRRSSTTVRVTAQLIETSDDVHLWSEVYERNLSADDLFQIQDDIAETLAGRIADRYGPLGRVGASGSSSRTGSFDAYAAVLQFYDYYAQHHPERHGEARAALERAVDADPDYADAWAALAGTHIDEFRFNFNTVPNALPALERAKTAAQHAVILDPENVMAHQFLACAYFHDGELDEFYTMAERALALHPGHADALADIGTCYWLLGEAERGEALVARAIELSPMHPGWYHTAPMGSCYQAGDYAAALKEATLFYTPGFFWSHAWKAAILAGMGRLDAARSELNSLLEVYPDFSEQFAAETEKWRGGEAFVNQLAADLRRAGLRIG